MIYNYIIIVYINDHVATYNYFNVSIILILLYNNNNNNNKQVIILNKYIFYLTKYVIIYYKIFKYLENA